MLDPVELHLEHSFVFGQLEFFKDKFTISHMPWTVEARDKSHSRISVRSGPKVNFCMEDWKEDR